MRTPRASLFSALLALLLWTPAPSSAQGSRGDPGGPSFQQLVRLNSLGVAFLERFEFSEAARRFQEMLRIDPELVPAHVNLGIALFYLQDYPAALDSLRAALERDPDEPHALYLTGLIFRNENRVEESLLHFRQVSRIDPRDPANNYFLGLLYSQLEDYENAIASLRRVVAEEPYSASGHYNLALALMRTGNQTEGLLEMEAFRRLQGLFGSTTVGLQYMDQGKYAGAIESLSPGRLAGAAPEKPSDPIPITFTEAARESGLEFRHLGPGRRPGSQVESRADLETEQVPFMGSGVGIADYDRDGRLDLFFGNAGSPGARGALFRNLGDGRFENSTAQSGIDYSGNTMGVVWTDFDNDAHPDLYLINYGPNALFRNNGDGTFTEVTLAAGVGDPRWGMGGAAADYDHDGDLDLLIANFIDASGSIAAPLRFPSDFRGASNTLYRNNGNGTFSDVSQESGLSGAARKSLGLVATDFDNGRDIDFFVVNLEGSNQLFSNLRDGTFRELARAAGVSGPRLGPGAAAGDFNRDGLIDLALPDGTSGGGLLLVNQDHGRYSGTALRRAPAAGSFQDALFFDFDNDADLDLLFVSGNLFPPEGSVQDGGAAPNFTLLENDGGDFQDVSARVGLGRISGLPIRGLASADLDNDGDLDLVASVNGGSPLLLRNDGGNRNRWLSLDLAGTESNRLGIGTKVEMKAGTLYQKMEAGSGGGLLSSALTGVHFGLGGSSRVDAIRLLWPSGVLQAEVDPADATRIPLREFGRKGTSCPVLYLWDGEQYRFQTDVLGGAAYGYLLAPGTYNVPDSDEYVKLDRSLMDPVGDGLALTLNSQLEEVVLYDQVELVAVDHSGQYEVFPDEKLLPAPPYADFRLLTASGPRPPRAAYNGRGEDVLEAVSRVDGIYPSLVRELPFKGYAQEFELILDLGVLESQRAVLLLTGWTDYAESSSNLAAAQGGHRLRAPTLQIEDPSGRWVTVLEQMGFPAGLQKTMTVDLSGLLPAGSRRVRIVSNMRIYFDEILVASSPDRSDYRLFRLAPQKAALQFGGFPKLVPGEGSRPRSYSREEILPEAQWKVHVGAYTGYGDVLELLAGRDDRFVITRSGDEIEVFFDLTGLPPLPPGWTRDYLLYLDGYVKDMDLHGAGPDFVGPLPFHGMSSYPYPETESFPDDTLHREYLARWNTRFEGKQIQSLK